MGFLGYKIFGGKGKKEASLVIEKAGSSNSAYYAEVLQSTSTNKRYVAQDGSVKDGALLKNASIINQPVSSIPICTFPATSQEPLKTILPISNPDNSKCEFPITLQEPQVNITPMIEFKEPQGCVNPIDDSANQSIFCQSQNRIAIFDKNAQHIFRNEGGHFKIDSPANRKLLEDIVNNSDNFLGPDRYNNDWYACLTKDGKQIWAQVRNGEIRNAGINDIPLQFDSLTGLSRSVKPSKIKP